MKKNKGFTLVELSIVLIIVGLIAGGVLAGRSITIAARNQKVIQKMNEIATSYSAFRVRFNCIAGDCPNAESFGLGISGGPGENGNGNGLVDEDVGGNFTDEPLKYWHHLSRAGLTRESFDGATYQSKIGFPDLGLGDESVFLVRTHTPSDYSLINILGETNFLSIGRISTNAS